MKIKSSHILEALTHKCVTFKVILVYWKTSLLYILTVLNSQIQYMTKLTESEISQLVFPQ